jgi:cytochrome c oxidase subunit 2
LSLKAPPLAAGIFYSEPRLLLSLWSVVLLAGCAGPQSALDPAGPSASSIHWLGMVMYSGATFVTLLVTALMLVPFLRRRERRVSHSLFLWGGGVVLPGLTAWSMPRSGRR